MQCSLLKCATKLMGSNVTKMQTLVQTVWHEKRPIARHSKALTAPNSIGCNYMLI